MTAGALAVDRHTSINAAVAEMHASLHADEPDQAEEEEDPNEYLWR